MNVVEPLPLAGKGLGRGGRASRGAFLPTLTLTALLSACAVGPDYQAPETPAPPVFGAGEGYSSEAVQREFWTLFDDASLSALVAQALDANHDLRIALANLNEARALRREAFYDGLPVFNATAGYTHALTSGDRQPGFDRDFREIDLYHGSFDAAWELDLFGRVRRNLEASRAGEASLEAELHDVQLSVAAEVARTYFELRGAQERLAVARGNADNQGATLDYVQARVNAGRGTEFDLQRARAQLLATQATIPQFETAVATAIHRLSVLIGQPPNALSDSLAVPQSLPPLPQLTAIGDPAELLRRRPDIRAAERQLAAATARIGVATAELFPVVSFSGEIGFAVEDIDDAGSAVGETWSYGPSIRWAALDLGHVRARIAQSKARAEGQLARYEQTVLRALEETENALVAYGRSRQRLTLLHDTVTASERAAELAQLRYDGGASDFLDVLDAQRAQLEAEDRYTEARRDAATSLVALYKSLGGGWATPQQVAMARTDTVSKVR